MKFITQEYITFRLRPDDNIKKFEHYCRFLYMYITINAKRGEHEKNRE